MERWICIYTHVSNKQLFHTGFLPPAFFLFVFCIISSFCAHLVRTIVVCENAITVLLLSINFRLGYFVRFLLRNLASWQPLNYSHVKKKMLLFANEFKNSKIHKTQYWCVVGILLYSFYTRERTGEHDHTRINWNMDGDLFNVQI